jgi:hypothetical protein
MSEVERVEQIDTGTIKGKDNLCITAGVISKAPSKVYPHDMTFLELKRKGVTRYILMTPAEAAILGVALIRASALADLLIKIKKEAGSDWATNWEQRLRELYAIEQANKKLRKEEEVKVKSNEV